MWNIAGLHTIWEAAYSSWWKIGQQAGHSAALQATHSQQEPQPPSWWQEQEQQMQILNTIAMIHSYIKLHNDATEL